MKCFNIIKTGVDILKKENENKTLDIVTDTGDLNIPIIWIERYEYIKETNQLLILLKTKDEYQLNLDSILNICVD